MRLGEIWKRLPWKDKVDARPLDGYTPYGYSREQNATLGVPRNSFFIPETSDDVACSCIDANGGLGALFHRTDSSCITSSINSPPLSKRTRVRCAGVKISM